MKILGELPFFHGLSSQALEEINRHFVEVGYAAGEVIYHAGDPARRFYAVADGKVKLLQHALSGRNVLLDILIPGEFFGSLSPRDAMDYPDTAQAQTPVCALSINSAEFRTTLDRYPEAALIVLDLMANRLQAANENVFRLSSMEAEQRIASTLLKLGEKLGRSHEGGILIDLPLSRDELAEMTGTTTETASRTVSQFQAKGLIQGGRQWIAITDLDALKSVAQSG
ncbi:MAG: Crp/Fnr family transcriptional regulator [Chloroflexi bacterium]|nr:Crp/Fnr family transcriptional regulator [Chloroflexota bacterium]